MSYTFCIPQIYLIEYPLEYILRYPLEYLMQHPIAYPTDKDLNKENHEEPAV